MKSRALVAAVLSAITCIGFVLESKENAFADAALPVATLSTAPSVGVGSGSSSNQGALLSRRLVRKPADEAFILPYDPTTGEPWFTGNIILKFNDAVGARAAMTDSPAPYSMTGASIAGFNQILADQKLTVRQWINKTPGELATLEERARVHSGHAQPDLAGMMIIEGVETARLSSVALAINALPEIEFADIERVAILHQGCGPDAPAFCNAPSPNCNDPAGFACNPDPGGDAAEFGCKDATCCDLVATRIPYCNDGELPNGWDVICAAYANILCDGTIYDDVNPPLQARYDPCFTDPNNPPAVNPIFEDFVSGIQAGCLDPHSGRGCNKPACCFAVCTFDPFCCNEEWDQECVNLAFSPNLATSCAANPDPGPTPDYLPFSEPVLPGNGITPNPFAVAGQQLYLQRHRVNPLNPGGFGGSPFFGGEGLDLAGFEALQTEVSVAYQNGVAPLFRGDTIRVAVIEFSAFVNHEEFTKDAAGNLLLQPKVIQEPGQTILLIEGANNAPQHGTATLGEIVSGNNGFGVTGIAYNAQGYFFPIVSIEEGSRAQNAIVSCLQAFRAGDVVNHSWGSPPDRPLPAIPQYYTLIALGSDIGITTCCSAGNSDCPIQPQAGEADSGVIIVGAGHSGKKMTVANGGQILCPGYNACGGRYIRAPFSCYSGEDPVLAQVHIQAWGENVATTGYGDLFLGENGIPGNDSDPSQLNQLRTYSGSFSGTSSASPIIAGATANLQAFAKQVFGTPLPPAGIRGVMSGQSEAQCDLGLSQELCGVSLADCCPLGDPDCDGIFKPIGGFPRLRDAGVGVFTSTGWDGNGTEIRVIRGTQPSGDPWSSFLIRAVDLAALRIDTVRGRAGTTVEGLTYLGTGAITDLLATLTPPVQDPNTQISDISLRYVSRSSRNFVMLNAFIHNFETNRWEYFGARFLTLLYPAVPDGFSIPSGGGYTKYLNPSSGKIEVRIWTVGLGATQGHVISHDFIQLGVNDPFQPL